MPKYLITGCTGLLGSHIARHILTMDGEVRAIRRANSSFELLKDIKDEIEWFETDVLDVQGLAKAMQGVDFVIHAAAIVSFSPKMKQQMEWVNIEGTRNVVNMCLETGIQKLCYISSIAAIGRPLDKKNLDEKQKWENSPLNSHYGFSKYQGEQEVFRGVAEGLEAVAINPSLIIGAGNWDKSSTQLFKYVWDGKKYYPRGIINYVDVRDVAKAVLQLLHSNQKADRFILNAGHMRYTDFFSKIAQRFGNSVDYKLVKPWMGAIAWRLEKVKSWLTGKDPIITKETVASSASEITFNGSKITQSVEFEYTDIEDTLDWACSYFQEVNTKQ